MSWNVIISSEYEAWFLALPEKDRVAIAIDLEVLQDQGPQLGRPYVDQVKGSKFSNMKELRTTTGRSVYRSLFAFDPDRQAIVLAGGNKVGKNQQRFYRQLIERADTIYEKHLMRGRRKP